MRRANAFATTYIVMWLGDKSCDGTVNAENTTYASQLSYRIFINPIILQYVNFLWYDKDIKYNQAVELAVRSIIKKGIA